MIASEIKISYGAKVCATIVRAIPVISINVMVLASDVAFIRLMKSLL